LWGLIITVSIPAASNVCGYTSALVYDVKLAESSLLAVTDGKAEAQKSVIVRVRIFVALILTG
jgi:hypothetical protein